MPSEESTGDGATANKRNTSIGPALLDFFRAVRPVAPQFALVVILTMGIGATKKLSFDAQAVIFSADVSTESSNQAKFIAFGFSKVMPRSH